MNATLALVKLDLRRLLWRRRSLLVLAFTGVVCWSHAGWFPENPSGGQYHQFQVSMADIIPYHLNSPWILFPIEGVLLVALAVTSVIEERTFGISRLHVIRVGGITRWWIAKSLTGVALTFVVVGTVSATLVICGLLRGWTLTLSPSDFARSDTTMGLYAFGSAPTMTLVALALQVAVFAPAAILALTAASFIKRTTLAYALPFAAVVFEWRVVSRFPEGLEYRFDPFRQTNWVQHVDYSWWYTAGDIAVWALIGILGGAFAVRRFETTTEP